MNNNVINMKTYRWTESWREVYSHDGENGTLQAYVDTKSGSLEVVQMNDDGECFRSCLSPQEASDLILSLQTALKKPTVA